MKKLSTSFHRLNWMSLLLLVVCLGCNDNNMENSYERIFPQEEDYAPFEINDAVAELSLNADGTTWCLSFGESSNTVLNHSFGFEDAVRIDVTNMKEEYKNIKGSVIVSGTALFKYILFPKGGNAMGMKTYYYHFKIANITPIDSKVKTRSASESSMRCASNDTIK